MKKFDVIIESTEEAVIIYTASVEANDKEEAKRLVEEAIERDGTAFMEFDCTNEMIADSFKIEGNVESITDVQNNDKGE